MSFEQVMAGQICVLYTYCILLKVLKSIGEWPCSLPIERNLRGLIAAVGGTA